MTLARSSSLVAFDDGLEPTRDNLIYWPVQAVSLLLFVLNFGAR